MRRVVSGQHELARSYINKYLLSNDFPNFIAKPMSTCFRGFARKWLKHEGVGNALITKVITKNLVGGYWK